MSRATDPRPLLARALDQSADAIARVTPEQLALPTPCTAFDVRELVGHMLFAARRTALAGRRAEISQDGPAVVDAADDNRAEAFADTAADAVGAWEGPEALRGDIALPFGTFPAPVVAWIYTLEQVTHAWDLTVATGSAAPLDDELAEVVLAVGQDLVRPEFRGGEDMPFGPVVDVPADAPPYARLAGFLGRQPEFAAVPSIGGAA